jgi:hypothetical protein
MRETYGGERMISGSHDDAWPDLPYTAWKDTCATLHLWTQIVGKIRLAFTPWLNHSWHVPLYVTARGLTTSLIPYQDRAFEIAFDFNAGVLDIAASTGAHRQIALEPRTVAEFYALVIAGLAELGIPVSINEFPSEIAQAIPFGQDRLHRAYEAQYARRFWHVLLQVDRVLKRFRTGFIGKSSPVHFWWGGFDLAVTRFNGRRAPERPGADAMTKEAYSHEVISAGFWPGSGPVTEPSFYAYAAPAPDGFKDARVRPDAAFFTQEFGGEFLLKYEDVRTSASPRRTLMQFLQSTYDAGATLGHWNRKELER